MMSRSIALVACALSMVCIASPADARVSAVQKVEKEVVEKDAQGKSVLKRVKADKVTPGEEVIYTLNFSNSGNDEAENVVLVMPVPEEISYIEGSVTGEDAAIAFSADGGQTYAPRGRLNVRENGDERPAQSNDITHIRWTMPRLRPNSDGKVSYRGILK